MYILKKLSLVAAALTMLSTVGTAPVQALRLDFQSPDGTTTGSITLNGLANLEAGRNASTEYITLTPAEGPSWIGTAYTSSSLPLVKWGSSWQVLTPLTSYWYHGTPESNPNPSYPFTHAGHFSLQLNCSLDLLNCLGSSGTMRMSSGTVSAQEWYDGPIVFSGFEYPQEEEVPPNPPSPEEEVPPNPPSPEEEVPPNPPSPEEEVPPNPKPPTSVPEPSSTLGLLLLGGAWLLGRKLQIK